MKKQYLFAAAAVVLSIGMLTGCGSKKLSISDYDPLEYVELGEYKNLEFDYDSSFEVTEDEIDEEITRELDDHVTITDAPEDVTVAADDSVVIVDYDGKNDDGTLTNATAKDAQIVLGTSQVIDDLNNGIVGMKIGETKEIPVVFPEDYHHSEIAGKPANFTVTLKALKVRNVPELTDEFVASLEIEGVATVDQYREHVKTTLQSQKQQSIESYKSYTALEKIMDEATVKKYPEDLLKQMIDEYTENAKLAAEQNSMEYADYLSANGYTEETVKTYFEDTAKSNIKQEFVFAAIAKLENITLSDEEYMSKGDQMAKSAGLEDFEAYAKACGFESVEKMDESVKIKDYFLKMKIMDFISENTKLNEKPAAAKE